MESKELDSSIFKKSVPVIVSDINGVLLCGKVPTHNTVKAFNILRKPLVEIDPAKFTNMDKHRKLPFFCLTNSGGSLEKEKAMQLNRALQIKDYSMKLKKKNIFINFSALKFKMKEYTEKLVLICGVNSERVAEDNGIKNYIAVNEMCQIWPQLCPVSRRGTMVQAEVDMTKKDLKERLGWTEENFHEPPQIHAIIILNDMERWDEKLQVIIDYCSGSDGKIPEVYPKVAPESHIKIFAPNNDFNYQDDFVLPRLGFGAFITCLQKSYGKIFKNAEGQPAQLDIEIYGKPEKIAFENAQLFIEERTDECFELSNFYMIGDNPKSDIRGGNRVGWVTILVQLA